MELNEIVERPGLVLWEDGVDELVLGLFVAIYCAILLALNRLPHDWGGGFGGFSGPVLLAGMGFGIYRTRNLLRRTIVFPRGGYVALQNDGRKRAQMRF
jgi:hypothetical protein